MHRIRIIHSITVLLLSTFAAQAMSIVQVTPASHSLTASRNVEITFTFDTALDPSTINTSTVTVFGHWSGVAVGTLALEESNTRVRFTPTTMFNAGEWVCVTIAKSVESLSGENLLNGYSWQFWIRPASGDIELEEIERISTRENGEGHIQTYGAHGGDLNHDGLSDFFVPNEISNDCRVFINDGNGVYTDFDIYPIPHGSRPSTNESTDFNADGHLDLAVGNSTSDSITIFLGDGIGGFLSIKNYQAAEGIRGLAVSDMDGDGDFDIVTANRAANNVTIMHNHGDGTFAPRIIIDGHGSGETACATADANGDGILDVFVGSHGSGEISLLLGDGVGGFTFSDKVNAGGGGTWMVAVGDVNGDGNVDVASANSQSSNAGVVFGDGSGGLASATIYPTEGFPIAIDLGDLDGDGDLDLMTSNYSGGNWTYWENDGTGTYINRRILESDDAASCATFHDRDNDGDLDMTGIDEESDLVFLFVNNGVSSINNEKVPEVRINVYPNPAQSGWHVEIAEDECDYIRIVDLSGKLISQYPCNEHIFFIPAGIISEGMYVLQAFGTKHELMTSRNVHLIK